jgi:hypothetical protein
LRGIGCKVPETACFFLGKSIDRRSQGRHPVGKEALKHADNQLFQPVATAVERVQPMPHLCAAFDFRDGLGPFRRRQHFGGSESKAAVVNIENTLTDVASLLGLKIIRTVAQRISDAFRFPLNDGFFQINAFDARPSFNELLRERYALELAQPKPDRLDRFFGQQQTILGRDRVNGWHLIAFGHEFPVGAGPVPFDKHPVEVVSGTHRLIDAMRERFNLIWLAVEKNVLDLRCKGFVNGYRSRTCRSGRPCVGGPPR